MLLRFLFTALISHCAICAIVLFTAGGFAASLFFVGLGYFWFLEGLGHIPILIIPAIGTFVISILLLIYSEDRPKVFLLFVGLSPIIVFLGLSEVVVFVAMRISLLSLEQGACIFDSQTFTASLLDLIKNTDFLFGDTIRYKHHAHVALPNERLMIWSYAELSFVSFESDHANRQQIPQKCLSV